MTILLTLHVIITIAMIAVILLQKSDGGASLLGSGGSGSMFSARGVANLLTHTTAVLATLFLSLCIIMTIVSTKQLKKAASFLDGPKSTVTSTVSADQNEAAKSAASTASDVQSKAAANTAPALAKSSVVAQSDSASAATKPVATAKTANAVTEKSSVQHESLGQAKK